MMVPDPTNALQIKVREAEHDDISSITAILDQADRLHATLRPDLFQVAALTSARRESVAEAIEFYRREYFAIQSLRVELSLPSVG